MGGSRPPPILGPSAIILYDPKAARLVDDQIATPRHDQAGRVDDACEESSHCL